MGGGACTQFGCSPVRPEVSRSWRQGAVSRRKMGLAFLPPFAETGVVTPSSFWLRPAFLRPASAGLLALWGLGRCILHESVG
jgi:hypothetical protein